MIIDGESSNPSLSRDLAIHHRISQELDGRLIIPLASRVYQTKHQQERIACVLLEH